MYNIIRYIVLLCIYNIFEVNDFDMGDSIKYTILLLIYNLFVYVMYNIIRYIVLL